MTTLWIVEHGGQYSSDRQLVLGVCSDEEDAYRRIDVQIRAQYGADEWVMFHRVSSADGHWVMRHKLHGDWFSATPFQLDGEWKVP